MYRDKDNERVLAARLSEICFGLLRCTAYRYLTTQCDKTQLCENCDLSIGIIENKPIHQTPNSGLSIQLPESFMLNTIT